uniref:FBA_2 domain-containing protein n=1 Tax=Caenorhabditis tropicalis TaxID=1561998 RepID=A0A1I7UTN5_9PELO
MSKRAKNTLKLTSDSFFFSISNELLVYGKAANTWDGQSKPTDEILKYFFEGETIGFCLYPDRVILREQSLQKQLVVAQHLLDTFRKPTIYVAFYDPALPSTAWEFMKIINERKLSVKSFVYRITEDSSEFIPRIMDECTEITDCIWINAIFRDEKTNWINLENFLNCRRIILHLNKNSNLTPHSWNTFLRNWINSDAQLECLCCYNIKPTDFLLMVDGLSDEGINRRRAYEWVDVKRRDGTEFVIGRIFDYMYLETREEHLEAWWRQ